MYSTKQSAAKYARGWRKTARYRSWRRRYTKRNRLKLRSQQRQYRKKLRINVLLRYGGKCQCCNEANEGFLTIDHIRGGGREHRKRMGGAGSIIYAWLRMNNYPRGFRVLCMNCNLSVSKGRGICAHKLKVLDEKK